MNFDKNQLLFFQLKNNIEKEFDPPEYKIAKAFHTDGFTEQELVDILVKTNIRDVYRNKIYNAFRDINYNVNTNYHDDIDYWENEQLYKLRMIKLRK